MGLFNAISLVVGSCIGAGIFITPGIVYQDAGSVGVDLFMWLAAGVASLIHGLCYAELGAMLPSAGGPYEYFSLGVQSLGRTGDLLSFLVAWCFLVADPISTTIHGRTFAAYALTFAYGTCTPPFEVTALVTVVVIQLAAAVNTFSLKTSLRIQNVLFMVKLGVLLCIIATGLVWWIKAPTVLNKFSFDTNRPSGKLLEAFVVASFTGSGSAMICCMTEEMSNPARIIPWSLMGGLFLVTGLHVLTNVAYFAVLDPQSLAAAEATAVTFAREAWGVAGEVLVPLIVCTCTFGTMSATFLSNSRLLMAAARKKHLPAIFSLITARSSLPLISTAWRCSLAMVFTLSGQVGFLAKVGMAGFSAVNLLVMFALLMLRVTMKHAARPVRVPTIIVVVNITVLLAIVAAPFFNGAEALVYQATLGCVLLGLPAYGVFKALQASKVAWTAYKFMQKLLICLPCAGHTDI
ncbi:large neutral amino acids transporter small subunit 1-like isoform X2 [Amblyomma americanum]